MMIHSSLALPYKLHTYALSCLDILVVGTYTSKYYMDQLYANKKPPRFIRVELNLRPLVIFEYG
jgi:hypothetical protein